MYYDIRDIKYKFEECGNRPLINCELLINNIEIKFKFDGTKYMHYHPTPLDTLIRLKSLKYYDTFLRKLKIEKLICIK